MNIQADNFNKGSEELVCSTASLLNRSEAPGSRALSAAIIADMNRIEEKFGTAWDSRQRLFISLAVDLFTEAYGSGETLDLIKGLAYLNNKTDEECLLFAYELHDYAERLEEHED
ncbi:MAG: hypothetical protein AAF198_06390 [Pseudomonadota bacterium]